MSNWWDSSPVVQNSSPFDVALAQEGVTGKLGDVARSIYQQESGGGRNTKTSNRNAMGGMQIIPETFNSVADKGWDITNPEHNMRAGIRYLKKLDIQSGGDPALTAAGYYGGPGGLEKARRGIAVYDPVNLRKAPNTLEYGQQVVARMPKSRIVNALNSVTDAIIPAAQAAPKDDQWWANSPVVRQQKATTPTETNGVAQFGKNVAGGLLRGAGSIGATIAMPFESSADNQDRRKRLDTNARDLLGSDTDSWTYQGSKIAGEVLGTAGAGGLLAQGLTKVAPAAFASTPRLAQMVESLRSGGFSLGGQAATTLSGRAADIGVRSIGGAAAGGAQSALVDPNDAGTGALIGGLLPGAVKGVGAIAGGLGDAVRYVKSPAENRLAEKLAQSLGMSADELTQAVTRQGPQMMPGYQATVPQLLQNPVASQLQRTLKTSGANALGDAEKVQQGQMRAALERVAPIDVTVQDAAARAGGSIESYAKPARVDAGKRVTSAFESVDPFGESNLYLPLKEMESAAAKYLGAGTFGTGGKAAQAISTARQVGTQELPAIQPISQAALGKGENLEQAVRGAGGLRGKSGELRDLGIRQSGTTGLINNKSGQSADLLAEKMYERGFLPDNDPATLYEMLRNGAGRKVFSSEFADVPFSQMAENAMGEMPGAQTIAKAVPFKTIQNLRSSMGEAAEQAAAKGANKEAAALRQMVSDIDGKINKAASGGALDGEFFDKTMADQYREALKLHAAKMDKFETGPQVSMFRKGGDGQASIQGAEIPGKFYSGRRSQVDDVKSLKRLVGDQPALMDDMKRYAVTEGAGTSNVAGDLTSKYSKWLQSRSGANTELFTAQENATLKEVGKSVERSLNAESLGRVSGSDTAQKLEALNRLGLLDSKMVNMLATRIPGIGSFTGPMLNSLKETAGQTRDNALAKLLANPDELIEALKKQPKAQTYRLDNLLEKSGRIGAKFAPVIGAQ